MERITRTKNGNIDIYKDNDTFILDADKNEKLTDEQLQEIANKINKGVEDGRAEDWKCGVFKNFIP